jgi:5-methylcytosine-specific restriction endonuclease McrA
MRREAGTRSRVWDTSESGKLYKREYARKWRAAHPGRTRAMNKKCYLTNLARNPGQYRGYARKWRQNNPERSKEIGRNCYANNKRVYCDKAKDWRKRNPNLVLQFGHARRARKQAATVEDCTIKITILKKTRFCHWCCTPLIPKTVTIDHVVPLARGGKHCNDNLVAACKSCNTSKNDNLVHEWTWREAA